MASPQLSSVFGSNIIFQLDFLQFVGTKAEKTEELIVRKDDAALHIVNDKGISNVLNHAPEALLTLAQFRFAPFALRDVSYY